MELPQLESNKDALIATQQAGTLAVRPRKLRASQRNREMRVQLCAAALLALCAPAKGASFDVIVYGGSPGGVAAAITAANGTGLRVALLEPSPFLGGMSGPGGIGLRDTANAGEGGSGTVLHAWLRCVNAAYNESGITIRQPDYNVSQACWDELVGDPRYNLTVARSAPLDEAADAVTRNGLAIASIRTIDGRVWAGSIFIDATYEADVMRRVATYTVGREARATYGEPLAGVINHTVFQQFPAGVNPFWPNGTLLDGVEDATASPAPGEADDRVMPSSWRLCITKDAKNSVPWPRPAGYDARKFELVTRFAEALGDGKTINDFVGVYDYVRHRLQHFARSAGWDPNSINATFTHTVRLSGLGHAPAEVRSLRKRCALYGSALTFIHRIRHCVVRSARRDSRHHSRLGHGVGLHARQRAPRARVDAHKLLGLWPVRGRVGLQRQLAASNVCARGRETRRRRRDDAGEHGHGRVRALGHRRRRVDD